MSTSTRWTVAVLVVVVALGVALWTQLGDDRSPTGSLSPGTGQARDRNQFGQGQWPGSRGVEDGDRFVNHADAARLSHNSILESHLLRRQI